MVVVAFNSFCWKNQGSHPRWSCPIGAMHVHM